MTTNPRLALVKNDVGELVPSINQQGTQDMQVAGTVISINPKELVNETSGKSYFQGTANINVGGKEIKNAPALFAGSTIENIEKGSEYWFTARKSDDGTRTNLSCGGLRVVAGLNASIADELSVLLATPVTEVNATA
jgi:hypothetical protein